MSTIYDKENTGSKKAARTPEHKSYKPLSGESSSARQMRNAAQHGEKRKGQETREDSELVTTQNEYGRGDTESAK